MSDERYLCRGKTIGSGEWVMGYRCKKLICGSHGVKLVDAIQVIVSCCEIQTIEIDPATLGRSTGFKDKNGTRIYESDIVYYLFGLKEEFGIVKFGKHNNELQVAGDWEHGDLGFYISWDENCNLRNDMFTWENKVEVVRNIHDTPELLNGGVKRNEQNQNNPAEL